MYRYEQLTTLQLQKTIGGSNFIDYMKSYYKGLWRGLTG